jgi:hypothetical protein
MNKRFTCGLLACLLVGACSGKQERSARAEVVYDTAQCSQSVAGAQLLQSDEEFYALAKSSPKHIKLGVGDEEASHEKLNFDAYHYLLLSAGVKPTGGYQYVLQSDLAIIKQNVLSLNVELQSPPKDSMQAQMITYPCTVISIEKLGYESIETLGWQIDTQS